MQIGNLKSLATQWQEGGSTGSAFLGMPVILSHCLSSDANRASESLYLSRSDSKSRIPSSEDCSTWLSVFNMISSRLTRCFHIRFFKSRSSSAGISSEGVCATWKSSAKPHNRCNVVPEDTSVSTRGENGVDGRKGEIVRERGSRNDYLVRR
jgi:hypothetical protein